MKNAILGLLEKTIDQLPSDQIVNLAQSLELSSVEWKIFYEFIRKQGCKEAFIILHQKPQIRTSFQFLGEQYERWLNEGKYEHLSMPHFSTHSENFKGVLRTIARRSYQLNDRIMKLKTEQYGVRFLNNMYELSNIFRETDPSPYIDQLYHLDHSKELVPRVSDMARGYPILLIHYSVKRFFRLLLSIDESTSGDVRLMLRELSGLTLEEQKTILPRKPRTMRELHDSLDRELLKRKSDPTVPLEQSISAINGMKCGEYLIEVPATAGDLQATSIELKHCVHTYAKRVREKECQILNLVQDGSRKYTVELRAQPDGFSIEQFKGPRNESTMEGEQGKVLRQQLIEILSAH